MVDRNIGILCSRLFCSDQWICCLLYTSTTVASLGAVIEGDQLGLGTNLFSSKQTLIERFGIPTMKNEIGRKSKLMEELADIDENKEEILARDGKLPAADIAVDSYQFQSGALPVTVSNIRNVKGDVYKRQV